MENKLEDKFEGFLIPHQILLSPGIWNGKNYSAEEIENSFKITDWSDPSVTTLIADHNDDDIENKPRSIHDWEGNIENLVVEDGKLFGDVRLFDLNSIYKLRDGKAKFGISVKVAGDDFNGNVCNFSYKNFSLVVNPACKDAYLKLSEKEKEKSFFILNEIDNKLFEQKTINAENEGNHISELNSESIEMKGGNLIKKNMAEEELNKTSEMPKEDEAKKDEKVEEKMTEEELSEEQILGKAIEILQKKMKKVEMPVQKCSEVTEFSKLSERVEKLEQMITEKLSELTQKLSAFESEKTIQKLSKSEEVSKITQKLSAELNNKFSMHSKGVSKGTLDIASSLLEIYK